MDLRRSGEGVVVHLEVFGAKPSADVVGETTALDGRDVEWLNARHDGDLRSSQ